MRFKHVDAVSACLVVGLLLVAASAGRGLLALTLTLTAGLAWWCGKAAKAFGGKQKAALNVTFVLETMRASHYSEKARWCLQHAGADFTEEPDVGLLGVTLLWRTVPRLTVLPPRAFPHLVTGSSYCVAAMHSALLLDGGDCETLAWLRFRPDTKELEEQIDKLGTCVQKILWGELLDPSLEPAVVQANSRVVRHAWGLTDTTLPAWQRLLGSVLWPVMTSFARKAFPPSRRQQGWDKASELLQGFEDRLSDGRPFLHGAELSSTDISLAAINYVWVLDTPERKRLFSNGSDQGLFESMPQCRPVDEMVRQFSERFPRTYRHGVMMYEKHRR